MGIEAIGRVASGIGRGPNMARGISVISNPFKGPGSYIENRGPSLLGFRVDSIKNPRVEGKIGKFREFGGFSGARRSEAERIVAVTKKPAVIRLPNPTRGLDMRVLSNPLQAPKIEAVPQSIGQQRAENKSTPAQRLVQAEQIVEEKKVLKKQNEENKQSLRSNDLKAQSKKSEKTITLKSKIVEAVRVTEARKHAVMEAVKRAKEKTGSIKVKRVLEFLSVEFWKYLSPLVGKSGKDGTIDLTLKAIATSSTRYDSLEEAQTGLSRFVEEHIPLEKGEGSRVATLGEVREVLEGKEKEATKSQALAEIVVTRVVGEKEEVVGEPTLRSLGLEEIFQKAA